MVAAPHRRAAVPVHWPCSRFCSRSARDATEPGPRRSRTLTDPATCKGLPPVPLRVQWAGSMHAYAADESGLPGHEPPCPARQPRDRDVCVQCHAPVAVREGLTKDGLNLDELPREKTGRHLLLLPLAQKVDGTHNNPLVLATYGTLFGPFDDPDPADAAQGEVLAPLRRRRRPSPRPQCGSCHDIQNLLGAHVERTFEEWQGTLFASTPAGQSCAGCHMPVRKWAGVDAVVGRRARVHSHAFPAVESGPHPLPGREPAERAAAGGRAGAGSTPSCRGRSAWNRRPGAFELTLDNVSAGHSWPSGATPDRRAWVELVRVRRRAGHLHERRRGGPSARGVAGSRSLASARLPVRRRRDRGRPCSGRRRGSPATRFRARSSPT
jgi:mono/diheme cytochrome c family protein